MSAPLRPDRSLDTTPRRELCLRCLRPRAVCWCAHLEPQPSRTHVVFLQHPRESRVPVGTARMAHLALPNSELLTGVRFGEHPRVRSVVRDPRAALLFPGPGSVDPRELPEPPSTLVVVDGTWSQARTVVRENPCLQALPRVGLRPDRPGNYRIRKEPDEHSLSTIEAVSMVLGALEGEPERFASLLRAFEYMVERQLEWVRNGPGRGRGRRRPAVPPWLVELQSELPRLVLVFAEANAQPRESPTPGARELLHLVAERATGPERFEAILAPRRPLGPNTARHAELPAERLLAGEPVADALARFRAFLRPDDRLCGWGAFARDLLVQEGENPPPLLDLRPLAARRLHRAPGTVREATLALGGCGAREPRGPGRAGRALAELGDFLDALLLPTRSP